jgi:hypothetical protein
MGRYFKNMFALLVPAILYSNSYIIAQAYFRNLNAVFSRIKFIGDANPNIARVSAPSILIHVLCDSNIRSFPGCKFEPFDKNNWISFNEITLGINTEWILFLNRKFKYYQVSSIADSK